MSGMWKLSLDVEIEPAVLKEIFPLQLLYERMDYYFIKH